MTDSAVPLTQRTKTNELVDLRFRGIGTPVVKRPKGYFQTLFTRDLIRSSIYNILTTRKGERVFVPEFGTNLHKLLFEPGDAVTKKLIKQTVTEDVTRWERRVSVSNVRVSTQEYQISVYVEYRILSNDQIETLAVDFSPETFTATLGS